MTEYSEHLSVIMTRNGRRSYFFKAPLVEGYTLAKEPYREFRKGVEITTYQDDSLTTVDAVLTALEDGGYHGLLTVEFIVGPDKDYPKSLRGSRLYAEQLLAKTRDTASRHGG